MLLRLTDLYVDQELSQQKFTLKQMLFWLTPFFNALNSIFYNMNLMSLFNLSNRKNNMETSVHWIKNKHDLSLFFVSFTYLFSSFRLFSRAAFSISNRRWSLRSRNICFSTYLKKKKQIHTYNLKVTELF